jgi:hypothetical protein
VSPEFPSKPLYLGDGVYADHDGWHVVLSTQASVESDQPQRIFLDPHVWAALKEYMDALEKGP